MPLKPLKLNNFETVQTERANRYISFQWGEKLRGRRKKKAHSNRYIINTVCYATSFCENFTGEVFLDLKVQNQQGCSQPHKSQ